MEYIAAAIASAVGFGSGSGSGSGGVGVPVGFAFGFPSSTDNNSSTYPPLLNSTTGGPTAAANCSFYRTQTHLNDSAIQAVPIQCRWYSWIIAVVAIFVASSISNVGFNLQKLALKKRKVGGVWGLGVGVWRLVAGYPFHACAARCTMCVSGVGACLWTLL